MKRVRLASILSRRRRRRRLLAVAIVGLLAAPGATAQDAGVSGVPPGPANARGLNGSVNDPSGIGNAARVPAIPPPTITPITPPALIAPAVIRPYPLQGTTTIRPTRSVAPLPRGKAAKAAIKEQDRLLDRNLTSICRGC